MLALVPVDDVWGVGRRLSKRLNALKNSDFESEVLLS
ncbi:hypothetical protein [Marinomonas sp. IMCC 4694]